MRLPSTDVVSDKYVTWSANRIDLFYGDENHQTFDRQSP